MYACSGDIPGVRRERQRSELRGARGVQREVDFGVCRGRLAKGHLCHLGPLIEHGEDGERAVLAQREERGAPLLRLRRVQRRHRLDGDGQRGQLDHIRVLQRVQLAHARRLRPQHVAVRKPHQQTWERAFEGGLPPRQADGAARHLHDGQPLDGRLEHQAEDVAVVARRRTVLGGPVEADTRDRLLGEALPPHQREAVRIAHEQAEHAVVAAHRRDGARATGGEAAQRRLARDLNLCREQAGARVQAAKGAIRVDRQELVAPCLA
mmetsp:Transcript_28929/g.70421  ORF Transcript_28929/g.70421 Transcript_28929/m.70421 type:complete len:265 (-) Transcript_28929:766-1560(-)